MERWVTTEPIYGLSKRRVVSTSSTLYWIMSLFEFCHLQLYMIFIFIWNITVIIFYFFTWFKHVLCSILHWPFDINPQHYTLCLPLICGVCKSGINVFFVVVVVVVWAYLRSNPALHFPGCYISSITPAIGWTLSHLHAWLHCVEEATLTLTLDLSHLASLLPQICHRTRAAKPPNTDDPPPTERWAAGASLV